MSIQAHELERAGGRWLGAARNWLLHNLPRADRLTWGSSENIEMTVLQFEQAAAAIAAAAINEDRISQHARSIRS